MGHPHAAAVDPHASSAHGHGGADHVPHVLPLWVYLATWGVLMVLTAITVGVSYIDVGPFNIVIALLIATLKAATVASLFMHLWFDNKFHTMILVSSVLFLVIFIAFTMFDTEVRGRGDEVRADHPTDINNPFGGRQSEVAIRARAQGVPLPSNWLPPGRGEVAPAPAAAASGGMAPAGTVAGGQGSAALTAASMAAVGPNAPGGATLGAAAAEGSGVPSASASAPAAAAPSASGAAAPSVSASAAPSVPHNRIH